MPQHTIGLLEVRIVHNQSEEEVHPSKFGPRGVDLLDEWGMYLEQVEVAGGVSVKERYFTPQSIESHLQMREVQSELDYGHFGSPRRVRDAHTGSQTGDIATNEVPSEALRTLLRVPRNGTTCFIAHEVVGRLTAAGLFSQDLKKWFGNRHDGYRIELDYVEDSDAWNEFLDGATLRELTFTARRSAKGNRAGRPTKEQYDVRPAMRGDVLPHSWLERLRSDGYLPANEVLSVSVNQEDIDETRVVVSKDKRRRTISIGAAWPRFTWEIEPNSNERPSDLMFVDVARQIIGQQLTRLKIDG